MPHRQEARLNRLTWGAACQDTNHRCPMLPLLIPSASTLFLGTWQLSLLWSARRLHRLSKWVSASLCCNKEVLPATRR